MAAAYEGFRCDGRLPATFEVVHAHAWKPLHALRRDADGAQPLRFHSRRAGRP
jgi:malonyl-CoA O-methyltransferase